MGDLDEQVRAGLERLAGPIGGDARNVLASVVARRRRRRRRRAAVVGVAGMAVAVLAVAVVVPIGDDEVRRETTAAAAPDPNDLIGPPAGPGPSTTPGETGPTGPSSSPGPTATAAASGALGPYGVVQLSPGAWMGARTNADGTELLVAFVGAAPFEATDPCSVDYRAEAAETADRVAITLYGRRTTAEPIACNEVGYSRTATVMLRWPLGARRVLLGDNGVNRPVFDGATLATPTWLPDGWVLRNDVPGMLAADGGAAWQRTWGATPSGRRTDSCIASPSTPVSLIQGPPAIADALSRANLAEQATYDVRGAEAIFGAVTGGTMAYLSWSEAGQHFVVMTVAGCAGDTLTPADVLLRVARSLTVPS